jgi:hypothetical protein
MPTDYIGIAQQHIADTYPTLVYWKPPMSHLPPGAILGTWAYSVPGKVRYMLNKDAEIARGVLPSDLSRTWIKDVVTLPIKSRREQVDAKCYPLPLHARRGIYGECAYVDIKGAYINILQLGYNLEYLRNRYVGANFMEVPQQLKDNKLSYATAVSMSKSKLTAISVMGKEGPFTNRTFNLYSNPGLYNLASDTLASIASEVLRIFGQHIHYVNTDGYIIDRSLADNLIEVIHSWGFHARIKYEGQAEIFGVAAWRIGDKSTRRYDDNALDFTSTLPIKSESIWLKKRLTALNKHATMVLT